MKSTEMRKQADYMNVLNMFVSAVTYNDFLENELLPELHLYNIEEGKGYAS